MSINTAAVPTLSLRDTIAAMPLLTSWRNSKGRIMPLHFRSAPGVGKTMLPEAGVRSMARANPGTWVGLAAHHLGIKNPADVGGFLLFDDHDGAKVSLYSRPDLFAVPRAIMFVAAADGGGTWNEATCDDQGRPLYWGSIVGGQPLSMGILLLDENDQADIEVRKVSAPLFDEGRITSHHLPRDVAVWAASNRAKDASGTGRGLAFLTNRWCALEVEPDIEALSAYFRGVRIEDTIEPLSPTLPPELDARNGRVVRKPDDVDFMLHPACEAYMRQNWDTMTAGVPSDPNQPFLTPRSFDAMCNLFDVALRLSVADESGAMDPTFSFADSFVPRRSGGAIDGVTGDPVQRWRVFQALAGGAVGPDNVAQFLATLELFDEVPTVADIIKDPVKARVSDKTDAQFVAAYMVANAMRPDNATPMLRYAKRLQVSLYHNVVNNAVNRDGMLLQNPDVAQFFASNPDAIVRMTVIKAKTTVRKR